MTLDEAIKHCEEVAERQAYLSTQDHGYCEEKRNVEARERCAECASDHRQLAVWLTELKERRAADKQLGHWEEISEYGGWGETFYKCTYCGETEHISTKFCPNCGADMRGDSP